RALTMGRDGTAWAGTATGLVELTGVTAHSAGKSRRISTAGVRALHTSSDGRVWAATDEGLYNVIDGRLAPVAGGTRLRQITSIASDTRGTLWICDSAEGLIRIS